MLFLWVAKIGQNFVTHLEEGCLGAGRREEKSFFPQTICGQRERFETGPTFDLTAETPRHGETRGEDQENQTKRER
jgi:hypothetical protein